MSPSRSQIWHTRTGCALISASNLPDRSPYRDEPSTEAPPVVTDSRMNNTLAVADQHEGRPKVWMAKVTLRAACPRGRQVRVKVSVGLSGPLPLVHQGELCLSERFCLWHRLQIPVEASHQGRSRHILHRPQARNKARCTRVEERSTQSD